ncbi:MAG TPA: hypothetical protein VJQ82_17080 [Terriglobales bacterium]|nr:hypothetical protein [Terriglobales bacterium]
MTLVLSLVLSLLPLLGVAWIVVYGSVTTVDGLFMSLILLAISGVLFLNVLMELKNKLHPKEATPTRAGGSSSAAQGNVQRGRVANVQFFEAHVGEANKSIVTLEDGARSSHLVVLEGDVRNALPVGQRVEITLRKEGAANVLVNVSYA